MRVTVLCTDPNHPVNCWLISWRQKHAHEHAITICHDKSELFGGDILFLVSCAQIIGESIRQHFHHTLVLHASDLPHGRGWSPHIWAILEGQESITVSLLEAADGIDTGRIWSKKSVQVPKHALHDEINERLFNTEISLMSEGIRLIQTGNEPTAQPKDIEPTYYPKRQPSDSELNPDQSLREQFDQIRVADPDRYPAYFELHGHRYKLTLTKMDDGDSTDD